VADELHDLGSRRPDRRILDDPGVQADDVESVDTRPECVGILVRDRELGRQLP
jgi:hypothetical protein